MSYGAKIINRKLYYLAVDIDETKNENDLSRYSTYISDGYGLRLGEQHDNVYEPMEYKGEMVFRIDDGPGKEKLLDKNGKTIWENEEMSLDTMHAVDDNIIVVRDYGENLYSFETVIGDKEYSFDHRNPLNEPLATDMVISGDKIFVCFGDNDIKDIITDNKELISFLDIKSVVKYRDGIAFIAKVDAKKWEVIKMDKTGYTEKLQVMITEGADNLLIMGNRIICSAEIRGKIMVTIDRMGCRKLGKYDEVYEIKNIDIETVYVLGRKGNDLVKNVIKIDEMI